MLQIYTCIAAQHDQRLIVLAAAIAVVGSLASFSLLAHGRASVGRGRVPWLLAAGVTLGWAIWASHFIAMLAFEPDGRTGFTLELTAFSLLVAIAMAAAACLLALDTSRWLGGAVAGLAIAAVHYLGMAVFRGGGFILWDRPLVVMSLLAATALGAAAFIVGLDAPGRYRHLAAAGLLGLAIWGLHFMAMAAAVIVPYPVASGAGANLAPVLLALAVAACCLLILALLGLALQLEKRDIRRNAIELNRMHDLADAAVEGLLVSDGDLLVTANRSLLELIGLTIEALVVLHPADLVSCAVVSDTGIPTECYLASATGEQIPVEMVSRTVVYAGRPHSVTAFRDLRPHHRAEAEIRFLASHDAVTGLANRASFMTALERELASHRSRARPCAILAIDLDRFKAVNDALGHVLGDALLRQVAVRLRALLRDGDLAAGFGGDEFTILQRGVAQPDGAHALAARIAELFARPMVVEGQPIAVSVSVGVALVGEAPVTEFAPPVDGEALLQHADLALQRAKSEGGGTCRFFAPAMDSGMQESRALELDLRSALERDEFEVYFQPQLALASGRIAGFEALLRWRHPSRGMISPVNFIPVAEETGLIIPIGAWVLRTAMAAAQAWQEKLTIAINLSPVQFRAPDLLEQVTSALAASGLDPHRLELEITESVLLSESPETLRVLHQLRGLGIRVALDDFGTGFSSLSYLRSFPFDKIKIDRSFVGDLITNLECQAIVRAIVGLGRSLRITTTAEGVETEEQLAFMRTEGCDEIQGYLIGRPMPGQEAAGLAVEQEEGSAFFFEKKNQKTFNTPERIYV